MTKDKVYDSLKSKLGRSVAAQAAFYFDEEFYEKHKAKERDPEAPRSLVIAGFNWHKTTEGYGFWLNQCGKL